MSLSIKNILHDMPQGTHVRVLGWVKTRRVNKKAVFITLQDGSTQQHLQVVLDPARVAEELVKKLTTGASVAVEGKLVASLGMEQGKEVQASKVEVIGRAPETYPLQPKPHTLAFLRSIPHLRFRTNTFGAVFRVRHALGYAIHQFFQEQGFVWLHTPVITSVDAEGAGEVFDVVTREGKEDFFGARVSLTVSGQLAAEAGMMGLGKVYTFGPTFRAENSNTTRHLAEFWMVEPEMAFYDLEAVKALAEELMKYLVAYVLRHCDDELTFLEQREAQADEGTKKVPLRERLARFVADDMACITYTEAIRLLERPDKLVQLPAIEWGMDLQTPHERYLTEVFQGGVVVTDYPRDIKAFYMRLNEDKTTVAAMDMLLPGIGEVIGGSQREERYDELLAAMGRTGIPVKEMQWYLDTRLFGSVPHSGFGLGLERLMLFLTGMDNIRDVIPFPRTPGQASC